MPRRDFRKIVLLGAGPIVIGQGCEFDYSGTQATKTLLAEGYEVVLVNSNPATIMTDPGLATRTYVEPLEWRTVAEILRKERPDALLPTLGGQTALNLALALDREGVLAELGIEMLGARPESIQKAEDRSLFKAAMERIGLTCPAAVVVREVAEALSFAERIGYPIILRPSFTLGGEGGGIARTAVELAQKVEWAVRQSPTGEVLVEESVIGWKEVELEVVRDEVDNFLVVCTIENIDPMGVHTGDSVTVAPAMTLTDREYQRLRDAARAVMTEIGVTTGGSNVQFALAPDGRFHVIEMNPRVSRSSALASKATGYPIAKIATKLAVGYTLGEITNDITGTSAAFEPVLDYVVVKWPRFAFEKFPEADASLGTQMKSVGEAMAIGRSFPEALQKAARSLEHGADGLGSRAVDRNDEVEIDALLRRLEVPHAGRLFALADALRKGASNEAVVGATGIDPWFVAEIRRIVDEESVLRRGPLDEPLLRSAKRLGFSDRAIATLGGTTEEAVATARSAMGIVPTFLRVDTCAGERVASTPYFYGSWETQGDAVPSGKPCVVILGSGPNRIGQGLEFDTCCVQAVWGLREIGLETVLINSNPETVSTDYDTADRLYFEPLSLENVLAVCALEKPIGVIVQLGGQTPLRLAAGLEKAGVRVLGTSTDAIDRAEDRERFDALLAEVSAKRPESRIARTAEEAKQAAKEIGFPVLVRPSYVLGGRAMAVAHDEDELGGVMGAALDAARGAGSPTVLVDRYLDGAIELDVDLVSDGRRSVLGGVMEHFEAAGVHSGDSASMLPPQSLSPAIVGRAVSIAKELASKLGVVGLMNVQLAVADGEIFVLEVNPRASRTVPFVEKATGVPLSRLAAKIMLGRTLDDLGIEERPIPAYVAVKECVFPWKKLPGVDPILGPEMRSTGEVMGIAATWPEAYAKALLGIGVRLDVGGPKSAFFAIGAKDRPRAEELAARLEKLGFEVVDAGRQGALGRLERAEFSFAFVTAEGADEIAKTAPFRRAASRAGVTCFTTMALALAGCAALESRSRPSGVRPLQDWLGGVS